MYQMPKLIPSPKEIEKKTPNQDRLFGGGRVLGDSLGTLRNGVLGQLTGQDQTNTVRWPSQSMLITINVRTRRNSRGLDLPRRDGGLLVVGSQLAGLSGDTLEDVVHEGVEDGHGTVGDTSIGVDLLEDCRGVRMLAM